ncbi:hypothetical protein SteCoe_30191 [Stentor coeruleus]|uniref:Uncharacterized protein n=1 Tax=Stentor coeruleus TaxID=5963 RepID=A0A1R2B477_9CILI|nr:hypothetical protein SteCoe_30191 [Stentor coeruleus]
MTKLFETECNVNLKLIPDVPIKGTTKAILTDGTAEFSDLYVYTIGTYKIMISGECIEATESTESILITGVNSLSISLYSIYIEIHKEVSITIDYFGPLNSTINISTFVSLYSSNIKINGTSSLYGSSSKAIFNIKFDTLGQTTLSGSTNIDLATIVSKPLDIYILESLCLEKINNVCIKCVPLAFFFKGGCICNDLSYKVDVHCECIEGYIQNENQCTLQCYNAFKDSDIIGYYDEDLTKIYIVFSSSVIESSESNCSSRIALPEYPKSLLKNCLWINSKIMLLSFISVLDGKEFVIVLDESLTPVDEKCLYSISILNVTILSIEMIQPAINLLGPSFVYLLCDTNFIIIENILDNGYEYKWLANPTSYQLEALLNSVQTSKIEIPLSYFKEGKLDITCIAKNLIYNAYANETITITALNEKHLSLGFNIPNNALYSPQDTIFVQGFIENSCGYNNNASFIWTYLSSVYFDFKTIILNSPYSNSFLIPPYTLNPKNDYMFKLTATIESESINGSNTINIKIKPNDLSIKLSRYSGTISKTQDLIISANISDTDSLNSNITIEWSCFENVEQCKNSTGGLLEFYKNNSNIVVQKDALRNGAFYNFIVTAKTLDKENSESVQFYVDRSAQGELFIEYTKDDNSENVVMYGVVIGITDIVFKWETDLNVSNEVNTSNSFISIPKILFQSETNYNISLTISSASSNPLTAYIIIPQFHLPKCQTPVVEFQNTVWFIKITSCISDNYALKYQFGCLTYSKNILWLTFDSYISSVFAFIPSVCEKIVVEVCDGLFCSDIQNSIPDGVKTHGDIFNDFLYDIANHIQIPNAVIYYSSMITTQSDWEMIFVKMSTFFKSTFPTKGSSNVLISSLDAMTLQISLISQEGVNSIIEFTEYAISTYNNIFTTNQLSVISAILTRLITYIGFKMLSPMIKTIIGIYFEKTLPVNSPLILDSTISIYASRVFAASITKLEISTEKNSLKIPLSISLNSSSIYDIEYIIYPLDKNEIKFEVSFYTSGTYIENNLNLSSPKAVQLNSEIIYSTIKGEFSDNKNYECAYLLSDQTWITDGCKIYDLVDGKITMALSHQSTFKVYETPSNNSCEIGVGPIVTSCAWLMIAILCITVFYILDKNQVNESENENKYTFYPITSVFIHQSRRASSVLYLFSTHILLICLIGLLLQIFESPTDNADKKNNGFNINKIFPGIISLGLTQVFSTPIYWFLFNHKTSVKCVKITRLVSVSLSFVCMIGIILMTIFYCREFTFYWIIDYFIFLPLQLMIEIVLAYFMWKRRKLQISKLSSKVVPEKEMLNALVKEKENSSLEKKCQSIVNKDFSFDSNTVGFCSIVQGAQSIANDKIISFDSNTIEKLSFERKCYSIGDDKNLNNPSNDLEASNIS